LLAEGLGRDAAVQRILATTRAIGCGGGCFGSLDAAAAVALPPPAVTVSAAGAVRPAPAPAPAAARPAQPSSPPAAQASTDATQVPDATLPAEPRQASTGDGKVGLGLEGVNRRAQESGRLFAIVIVLILMAGVVALRSVRKLRAL
jgi:hypothetical protein